MLKKLGLIIVGLAVSCSLNAVTPTTYYYQVKDRDGMVLAQGGGEATYLRWDGHRYELHGVSHFWEGRQIFYFDASSLYIGAWEVFNTNDPVFDDAHAIWCEADFTLETFEPIKENSGLLQHLGVRMRTKESRCGPSIPVKWSPLDTGDVTFIVVYDSEGRDASEVFTGLKEEGAALLKDKER